MSYLEHFKIPPYRQEVCTELSKLDCCTEFPFRGELKCFLNVVRFIVKLIQVISTCCKCFMLLFIISSDIFKRFLKIFIE